MNNNNSSQFIRPISGDKRREQTLLISFLLPVIKYPSIRQSALLSVRPTIHHLSRVNLLCKNSDTNKIIAVNYNAIPNVSMITAMKSKSAIYLFAPSLPKHQPKVITYPHLGTKKTLISKKFLKKIRLVAELSGT